MVLYLLSRKQKRLPKVSHGYGLLKHSDLSMCLGRCNEDDMKIGDDNNGLSPTPKSFSSSTIVSNIIGIGRLVTEINCGGATVMNHGFCNLAIWTERHEEGGESAWRKNGKTSIKKRRRRRWLALTLSPKIYNAGVVCTNLKPGFNCSFHAVSLHVTNSVNALQNRNRWPIYLFGFYILIFLGELFSIHLEKWCRNFLKKNIFLIIFISYF